MSLEGGKKTGREKKKENGENHGRTRLIKILGWPSGPPTARYRNGESVYCFGTGYAESCDVRDAGRRGNEGGGESGGRGSGKIRYAPPSQAAILVLDRRIGSLAIIPIALRGWGWSCMAVCSKRGPVAGVGLGR